MKKAQISLEVLYSISIMIIIFIILTGISFTRRVDLNKLDEFLERKNECYRLSNIMNGVHSTGPNTIASVTIKNPTDIQMNGVIIIKEENNIITESSIEATCVFHADLDQNYIAGEGGTLSPTEHQRYDFYNDNGQILISAVK